MVGAVLSGAPDPKSRTLARGERRYRRKVASPKQWAAFRAAKLDGQACRVCSTYGGARFAADKAEQLHHVVARAHGGDDVMDNLVGICWEHHALITQRYHSACALLLSQLSDAEYSYMIQRGGEDYPERAYGVSYAREPQR